MKSVSLLITLALVLAATLPAAAHPLGNFTINHLVKIRVAGDHVYARYVLDLAEIPTFQVMRARSASGRFDRAELARWAASVTPTILSDFTLTVDGKRVVLFADAPHARTRPGAGGLPLLYWTADLHAALPRTHRERTLTAIDRVYQGRLGWKDIVVAPQAEPTHELLHYPGALLGSPRQVSAVSATLAASGAAIGIVAQEQAPPAPAGSSSQVRSNTLSDMIARGSSSPLFVLLTLLTAIGLGALHALEPGHGKTLLAASLVGARATSKQAVILAAGLTFAHTIGVILLGLAMLFAARSIVPEDIYPWITIGSGIAVAVLGARSLARYLHGAAPHDHGHALGAHDHARDDHLHHGGARGQDHIIPGNEPLSFANVVLVAMSGNIAPCPAALVVLLTALTLHQVAYGMVVVVAFSVGLAALLTAMGLGFVRGAAWISTRKEFDRLIANGPMLSASVISLIGAIMIGRGFSDSPAFHASALTVAALVACAIAGYALSAGHAHTHAHADEPGRADV